MAKYTIFESTNMASTVFAAKIYDAVSTVDIENGTFGYLDGLATGYAGDVIYNFKKGTSDGKFIVVADNPAWDYDNSKLVNQKKDKYIIPAGTPFRVREIKIRDEFAISIEGVTSATASLFDVGAYATIDAVTGKLVAAVEAPASTVAFAGKVARKRSSGATIVTPTQTIGSKTTLYEVRVDTLAHA